MVAVVNCRPLLEVYEYTTEEKHAVVRSLWAKDDYMRIFIKKYFLFMVRSVLKTVLNWVEKFSQERAKFEEENRSC
jgi:hypothetical protein